MNNKNTLSITAFCFVMTGCSMLTAPMEKPIIEDHSGHLGTFGTVAERRMVVTKSLLSNRLDSRYRSKTSHT
ncbi:MAG: hypothetical protein GY703_13000 [Gammaproteobacteria bacterium]|nr:hypothetical protein [Gammaproteobacteria bacterium]